MSTFDDFDSFYSKLVTWSRDRDLKIEPGTLMVAAAILSISEMENKGWTLRHEEMLKATRAAEAAKAAIVRELGV